MIFRTAEKCTLDKNRIADKNKEKVENIEIQLLGINDDLSLINTINANITSIHLPLPPFCNLTNIMDAISKKDENYSFINKVIEQCKKLNCGIVAHANITLERLYNIDREGILIDFIGKSGIIWHIENVTDEIPNENACIKAPVQVCDYINKRLNKDVCFPLLDVCHFLMIQDNFDGLLTFNLKSVLSLYKSDNYFIHLNYRIGTGDPATGGIHGATYETDLPLLEKILREIKYWNPTLVLEVYEKDYSKCSNVKIMEQRIKEIQANI